MIDKYTGQLAVVVPLGPTYVAGPGLSYQVRLHYSSRVWGTGLWVAGTSLPHNLEPHVLLQGDPAMPLGWRFSFGKVVEARTVPTVHIPLAFIAEDGSTHALYDRRFFSDTVADPNSFYYSRDGSYLRVKFVDTFTGYKVYSPDGNILTLSQNVTGFDDLPDTYNSDYGRGRNGWYTTAITNPYGDAITVAYRGQPTPWVPLQITIPSPGLASRVVNVNMIGNVVSGFSMPMTEGRTATYNLYSNTTTTLFRPVIPSHPTASANVRYRVWLSNWSCSGPDRLGQWAQSEFDRRSPAVAEGQGPQLDNVLTGLLLPA